MNKEIAKLFAKMFIARPDVKAIQRTSGAYNPVESPFTMEDLLDHIEGRRTYGHYLLNTSNQCKFFAFDIDLDELNPDKPDPNLIMPTEEVSDLEQKLDDGTYWFDGYALGDPRSTWLDRSAKTQRAYLKFQMRMMAQELARTIASEFDIPTAVTYTGAKGVHVYGFTGLLDAKDVREGAELILKKTDRYNLHLGSNFFKYKPIMGGNSRTSRDMTEIDDDLSNQCFTVEVFPKQTEIKEGGYGNLMRLPLGKNLKNTQDPTFFVDLRAPLTELKPRDAFEALTTLNQWL